MRAFIIFALCATIQTAAFQLSNTANRGLSSRISMTSNKDFYPFNKPSLRTNTELQAEKGEKGEEAPDGGVRQLMGIKGGTATKNIWAIRLQLCKPVTWIPLIWGVACGAAASGNYETWNPFGDPQDLSIVATDAAKAISCMVLSGPVLTGYTQTLNDWEDREIDAINEPNRPIPSGAITKDQVVQQIYALFFAGLALSFGLDNWAGNTGDIMNDYEITKLTILGIFVAYIYSAPPLKLKATGWAGSFALGSKT
jgi:chlorophyll synthase